MTGRDLYHRILRIHRWVYVHSNGWIGHKLLMGNPTLLLTTIGRRTGATRITALTYGRDGSAYLVVGSNGGSRNAPDWLVNIRNSPTSHIRVGRRHYQVTATIFLPGDRDFARQWQIVNGINKNRYTQYQLLTDRPIPIVRLQPRLTPSSAAQETR